MRCLHWRLVSRDHTTRNANWRRLHILWMASPKHVFDMQFQGLCIYKCFVYNMVAMHKHMLVDKPKKPMGSFIARL